MKQRRGVTIAEILVSISLMAMVAAALVLNIRGPRYKAESQGAAEVLAEELRTAQQTAISGRVPVALAIPSANGTQPWARSYYTLRGTVAPKVVRKREFGGDFPHARVFCGYWPLDSAALNDPSQGLTGANPQLGSPSDNFDFSAWGAPVPQDYTLVFMPDGSVRSNGMPMFDGAYHLLVCNDVGYGGASTPAGVAAPLISYFTPSQVASPQTITIAALGGISIDGGVTAVSSGTVALVESQGTPSGPSCPALTVKTSSPVIAAIDALPPVNPDGLPPGVDAACGPDGYLTMVTYAVDNQGGPLYCTWNASGGKFSRLGRLEMDYDAASNKWVSTNQWAPPYNPSPADQYSVSVRVEDDVNHVTVRNFGSTGKVGIVTGGTIVYSSIRGNEQEICAVRPDGTRAQRFRHGPDLEYVWDTDPVLSPDGSKIAFVSDRTGDEEIFVMNSDGTGLINLSNDWSSDYGPLTWSPDSTRVAWTSDRTGCQNIYCCRTDGNGLTAMTGETISDAINPSWSPDGTKVAYELIDYVSTFASQMFVASLSYSGGNVAVSSSLLVSRNTDPNVFWADAEGPATWTSDSQELAWTDTRDFYADPSMNTGLAIYKAKADGTTMNRLTTGALDCQSPAYSPNGNKIAYTRTDWNTWASDLCVMNAGGGGQQVVTSDPDMAVTFWHTWNGMSAPIAWSPNSQDLCFASYATGDGDLYRINQGGGNRLRVTNYTQEDVAGPNTPVFSWSSK